MSIGFTVKRGLHRVSKKRFQPSIYRDIDNGRYVPKDGEGGFVISFGCLRPRFWNRRVKRSMSKVPSIRKFLDPTIVRPKIWDWRNVNGVDYTDGEGSDQDGEGACTGYGGARLKGIMEKITGTWVSEFAERFIYNCARFIGGLLGQEGAYMIDVMNALKKYGACLRRYWPWTANGPDHDDWPPPDSNALKDALNWRISEFADCMIDEDGNPAADPIGNILDAIYQLGGVDCGIPWVQSWEAPWNGDCPLPGDNDEVLGGHSIGIVGYDELKGVMYFRNSWTAFWGNRGDGSFPLESVLVFRDHLGGCEFYRAVDAESHVCSDGQHWDVDQQACVDDGSGPQPSNCEDEDINCTMGCVNAATDFFTMLFCALNCLINYFLCKFSLSKFDKMTTKALGKKASVTKSMSFPKVGVTLSITLKKMKK